jgi:CBS domain-containing protein/uncharacterized protein (DUF2267 family)
VPLRPLSLPQLAHAAASLGIFFADKIFMETIEPFIHRKAVVLHESDSILRAAKAMCANQIGCVVVSDKEGHIVGIATDRDIACFGVGNDLPVDTPLGEVMTESPVFVHEHVLVSDVIRHMVEYGVRRIPVVSETARRGHRCTGVISLDDLLVAKVIDPESVALILKSQMARQPKFARSQREEKAEERSESRKAQTLSKFSKTIASRTELRPNASNKLTRIFLEGMVKRLHYAEATRFISQLPKKWQEELLDLPAGPDRHVTLSNILNRAAVHLALTEGEAEEAVKKLCEALAELLGHGEMAHVASQLPSDFREVITGNSAELDQPATRKNAAYEETHVSH